MEKFFLCLIPGYIFYTFIIGMMMFRQRYLAIMSKRVSVKYFQTYQGEVPAEVAILGNHFNNQFQLPVVFFITCLAVLQFRAVDVFTVALGYGFFLSRILHTMVHLGSNNLRLRPAAYFIGFLFIFGMWVRILFL